MTDPSTPSPPRDATPDWDALARFAAGESPADEARLVSGWLAEHPADAALLDRLGEVVRAGTASASAAVESEIDVEGALRRVRARRIEEARDADVLPFRAPERAVPARRQPRAWRSRWALGGLAAAAALAAVAVGLGRAGRDGATGGTQVAAAERVLTTGVGARDSLTLADGTRIVLAPASRLVVAAGYGDGRREVTLEGAAWFGVKHDAVRPFVVRAGNALVRDIGTAFVVRTDGAGAGGVSVSVTEGSVALGAAGAPAGAADGVVLAAGDRGEFRPDGQVVATRGGVTEDETAWTRGRLVYRAAPLDVVRADLRRWYGVELQVADSALAGRRLTATFEGDSLGTVLDIIATALGARVERAGNIATLRQAPNGGR
jgi:transmembrane sensor